MKRLIILLFLLPCLTAGAAEYNLYEYTAEQGAELVSYVALDEDNYVYNNLRDLTLMGIFRQERDFSLANYVSLPDALKLIFRTAGLETYAYACGEDIPKRNSLGINPSLPCNPADGFFIAAYEKGLITHERLMGYFSNQPGCGSMHYATRGEVIVWLTKLFGIAPSYDYTTLNRYGNTSLIADSYKPYFAAAMNSGAGIVVNGSYNPCSLIKNGDLVPLITCFYPFLLETHGIKSVTAMVTDSSANEEGELTVKLSDGTVLKCTPENTCLLAGSSYIDNLYMLLSPEAKSKKITYHIKDEKILFVSTNIIQPARETVSSTTAKLYFYDNSTNSAVFETENGLKQYFFSNGAQLNGEPVSEEKLMALTDCTFTVTFESVNSLSFKQITNLQTGGEM